MARLIFLVFTTTISFFGRTEATCHTSSDDCDVSYGPWSECDPCTRIKSRHLNIVTPPQFDGMPCPTSLVEHESCTPTAPCPADLPCPGQFDCGFLGRCVNDSLVCNGDDDCGNNADERNCTKSEFYQRSIEECLNLPSLPYLDQIGSGVNFVTGKLAGRVADNQRFMGFCRKAFDGDQNKVFRLPYNVDNFHFHVQASDDLDVKTYSSLSDYTKELNKAASDSWSETVSAHGGFKIFSAKMSESMSYSHTTTFQSIFNAMKDTQSTLFKISSEIQTAEFILKEKNLLLDSFFEQRLVKLPATFNAKSYFDFFNQYGAFYLHSGVLGGKYDHYYIFRNTDMKTSQQTTTTMSKCLKFSMSASMGFGSFFGASGNGGFDKCSSANGTEMSSLEVSRSATHKIVHIDGGTTEMAGKLAGAATLGNATFQETKYEQWVMGVQQNPILLHKTVRPICDLFLSSKDPQKTTKHQICLNATAAFLQPHSVEGCKSCKNGRPLNIAGQCQCACASNYIGQTCSTFLSPVIPVAPHMQKSAGSHNAVITAAQNSDTKSNIKFVTTGKLAINPPYMQWLDVGKYDIIIKMMEKRLFLLSSTQGSYIFGQGGHSGEYYIKEYDEFLKAVQSTKIDFTTFPDCSVGSGFCIVRDFDIDSHYNFILSLKVNGGQSSAVYKVDQSGKAVLKIDRPCAMDDSSDSKTVYVTTSCTDQIIVSCPSLSPATVKVFTAEGEPEDLSQFAGFADLITGIQQFNGAVWIHTNANQVAAYNLESWQQIFNYTGINDGNLGGPLDYSQLSVDFLGNLVIGQAHNHENGMHNYKLTIVEGTSKNVLAYVTLEAWNSCSDVATYRGKLYTLCNVKDDGSKKSILVFDYLK